MNEKTGTVQIRFADGSERDVMVHGVTMFQLMDVFDQFGITDFSQLDFNPANSLRNLRIMEAVCLKGLGEGWSVEKIRKEFADINQVAQVFAKIIEISNLSQPGAKTATTVSAASAGKDRKVRPYG